MFAATDPAIVIRPVELSMLTPADAPARLKVIGVVPVAATWNVPPMPLVTVVLLGEVIVGAIAMASTVNVKLCVALGLTALEAVIVKVCSPTTVVPAIVIRPVELFMLTPVGAPVRL